MTEKRGTNTPDGDLPEELRRLAAARFARPVSVPPEVDRMIAARARRHFARRSLSRRLARWSAAAAGIAASVLLVVHLTSREPERAAPSVAETAGGRVTILDAFALARRLEAGEVPDAVWDRNGDGAVNRTDVDLVAMAAVRIEGG